MIVSTILSLCNYWLPGKLQKRERQPTDTPDAKVGPRKHVELGMKKKTLSSPSHCSPDSMTQHHWYHQSMGEFSANITFFATATHAKYM